MVFGIPAQHILFGSLGVGLGGVLAHSAYKAKKGDTGPKGNIVRPYLLHDDNFKRNISGECIDTRAEKWSWQGGPHVGYAMYLAPREGQTKINPTGPPGSTSIVMYSLAFQLRKWEYKIEKADEWIEVSPVHAAYYQVTLKQKEELEGRIKSGLASAAQSVADLELLQHDARKYKEFLDYFGYDYDSDKKELKLNPKKKDEHALRAVFVDQVDQHTGEGISMRSIVSRWPTLIIDFLKLDDEIDPDKIKDKLNVSKAEAVVLSTKNRLYKEWKLLFEPQLKTRYIRIQELIQSREKSVEEYRKWLSPIIARHKMIAEGLQNPEIRGAYSTHFLPAGGHAISMNSITFWTWRDRSPIELQKGGGERESRLVLEEKIKPRSLEKDEWTMKNLIFHPEHGLIREYPWLTREWVIDKYKNVIKREGNPPGPAAWIHPRKYYYAFIIINIEKANIRLASGAELEDTTFDVNSIVVTENVLVTKLLELLAKREEMNRYIDQLLGIHKELSGKKMEIGKPSFAKQTFENFFDFFGMRFALLKRGPYERDIENRVVRFLIQPMANTRYVPIVNFIKRKSGIGE